jgi:AcrR family transcriptional regulator
MRARAATASADETPITLDLILDAAERRFAEAGFAAVSMRAIAAEAGLKNQASLYYYFPNKHALFEQVLRRGLAPVIALFADSTRGPATPAGVVAVLDRLLDYLSERPHLPRLVEWAGLGAGRRRSAAVPVPLAILYRTGLQALARASRPWPAADLPYLAAGIYQLVFGYFANADLLEIVLETDPRSAAAVEQQRRFLKRAIVRLLESPPGSRSAP